MSSNLLKSKHLPPLPGYRERTIRGNTVLERVKVVKAKVFIVSCRLPGDEPMRRSYEIKRSTGKADAITQALKTYREDVNVKPNVTVYTEVKELHDQIGATKASNVPARFKGKVIDPKAGVKDYHSDAVR